MYFRLKALSYCLVLILLSPLVTLLTLLYWTIARLYQLLAAGHRDQDHEVDEEASLPSRSVLVTGAPHTKVSLSVMSCHVMSCHV